MGKIAQMEGSFRKVYFRCQPRKIYYQGARFYCHRESASVLLEFLSNRVESNKKFQCVNISASTAYAQGALVAIVSPVYWNRDLGAGFSFLYLLTTQMIG